MRERGEEPQARQGRRSANNVGPKIDSETAMFAGKGKACASVPETTSKAEASTSMPTQSLLAASVTFGDCTYVAMLSFESDVLLHVVLVDRVTTRRMCVSRVFLRKD